MTRIISSIVTLPILFIIIYFGTTFHFFLLLEIIIFIGLYEFYRMLERGGLNCYKWGGIALGVLLPIGIFKEVSAYTDFFITSAVIIPFIFRIVSGNRFAVNQSPDPVQRQDILSAYTFNQISNTLFGILYVSWLMSYIVLIRMLDHGRELVFFVLLSTWMGDTAAYYGGKGFGKHKLAPLISPQKTVEGAIASLAGSICGAFIAKAWLHDMSLLHALLAGIVISIFGQFGDLSESLIKRSMHVKDSGGIIPGHGGMLDRVDSLLFSAPMFYYYYNRIV
ncbi:MAG: phosphatidate cytidylyltransferase [Nitrospinota bacterium]